MKRIIAILLVLILCLSTLLLCACDKEDKKDDQTTSSTSVTDQKPDDPKPDEKHQKYPKTMMIIDAVNKVIKSASAVGDISKMTIPAVSVGDIDFKSGQPIEGNIVDNIYFNGKDCLYVKFADNTYEFAGGYIIFDGNALYSVECNSATDVEVEKIADVGNLPFLGSLFSDGTLSKIPDDISTLFTDEQLAKFEEILNNIPKLSDEYKEDLGNGKYRIKKEYIKNFINYVYDAVNEISGNTEAQPIPEEVWQYFELITTNIDITESNGIISAVDVEVSFGDMIKFEAHLNSQGVNIKAKVNVPEGMAGDSKVYVDIELNVKQNNATFTADIDAGGVVISVNGKSNASETEFDFTFKDALGTEILANGKFNASGFEFDLTAKEAGGIEISADAKLNASEFEFNFSYADADENDIVVNVEYQYDANGIKKITATVNGIAANKLYSLNATPIVTYEKIDASFVYDRDKITTVGENFAEFKLNVVDKKTSVKIIDVNAYISFEKENTYKFGIKVDNPANDQDLDLSAIVKLGENVDDKIPDIGSEFDLEALWQEQQEDDYNDYWDDDFINPPDDHFNDYQDDDFND